MTIKQGLHVALKGLGAEGPVMRVRDRQRARRALRHDASSRGADGLPLPPPGLIDLVAGAQDPAVFLRYGAVAREIIGGTLARNGVQVEELDSMLDFGVGCGRVARQWNDVDVEIHGCDYNPVLVEWCEANLPHVRTAVNELNPPLPYERFDLVYALSVFTHLPEDAQIEWISELRRVTRVGGYVFFTTHGPSFPHSDPAFRTPEIATRLAQGSLVVFAPDHAGRNYCAALHPRAWVEDHMLDGFELVEYVERGAELPAVAETGGQDIYLIRRVA
jgi:SAM-dependent methyltransferase